jgi:hypothetical protein
MDDAKAKRMLSPRWIMGILLAILLLVGLLVGLAVTAGPSQGGEQSSASVVKQGGKELTILSSTVTPGEYEMMAMAEVKNTGSELISYAELEMQFYNASGEPSERYYTNGWSEYVRFIINDLAVGEVQTLYAKFPLTNEGSVKVKVNKLE